jgi:hypothetical protein
MARSAEARWPRLRDRAYDRGLLGKFGWCAASSRRRAVFAVSPVASIMMRSSASGTTVSVYSFCLCKIGYRACLDPNLDLDVLVPGGEFLISTSRDLPALVGPTRTDRCYRFPMAAIDLMRGRVCRRR